MTTTSTRTPEPTLLENYSLASKKGILHAAAVILNELGLEQRRVDILKFVVYRFLTVKDVRPDGLKSILKLIETYKIQVVLLLSEKTCVGDKGDLAQNIIIEFLAKLQMILDGQMVAIPTLDTISPSFSPVANTYISVFDRVTTERNHDKRKKNTFPLGAGDTVIVMPEGRCFRVTTTTGYDYLCTDYSVERCTRGRYLTLYQDGEVIYGYALTDVPDSID